MGADGGEDLAEVRPELLGVEALLVVAGAHAHVVGADEQRQHLRTS